MEKEGGIDTLGAAEGTMLFHSFLEKKKEGGWE